jgi:DNA-binding NarL/FixJ family response regulator
MSLSVLLVDDHELIRQGLARAFERDEQMTVVGQAGTVTEGLAQWRALRPNIVVTDLQLPDGTGHDLLRTIRSESEDVALIMLTLHSGDAQIFAAMEAGASAFLGKESRGAQVVAAAAHAAKAPRSFLCTELAGAMVRRQTSSATRLTPREQEILQLLAEGLRAGDIARKLYLGESTVKSHVTRIYEKLGASNRAQALVTAMRLGLLQDQLATAG